jgi:hypothetical protein
MWEVVMKRIAVIFTILCIVSSETFAKLPQRFFMLAKEVLDLEKRDQRLAKEVVERAMQETDKAKRTRILEEEMPKGDSLNIALAKMVPYIPLIKAEISKQKCLDIASIASCPLQDRTRAQQGDFVDTPCGQCLLLMRMLLLSGMRSKDAALIADTKAFIFQNLPLYKCLLMRTEVTNMSEQESDEKAKEYLELISALAEAEINKQPKGK